MGYICMKTTDLLLQYKIINMQQHFGRSNIDKLWYINNIKQFISDARRTIPIELRNILTSHEFDSHISTPEIGVLRLLPKVSKLPSINYAFVPNLTSRGIKSSLKDPIGVIQKCSDKVFSHLLYYIELAFITRVGLPSPSVTGINEAITRI